MPNFLLVKQHLNTLADAKKIIDLATQIKENHIQYSVQYDDEQDGTGIATTPTPPTISVMLVEQESFIHIPHIPIFDGNQKMNFIDSCIVALDVEAANFIETTPAEHKYYMPVEYVLGYTSLEKVENIEEVMRNYYGSEDS